MELFRALAQVATGTGPLLRARPRSRFEATEQGGRIDVVEPEVEAAAPGRAAAPPPSVDRAPVTGLAGSRPVDPAGVAPRPQAPLVGEGAAAPARVAPGPAAPVTTDRDDRPAAAPAPPPTERVVHERESHHTVERVVTRRVDGPAPAPAPSRRAADAAAPERPVRDERRPTAPVPTDLVAARPSPPRPDRPVDGPSRPPRPSSAPTAAARRERSTGERAAAPSAPTVVVHIGRLEVRTVAPATPAPKPVPLHFAGPDLGDFLGATP